MSDLIKSKPPRGRGLLFDIGRRGLALWHWLHVEDVRELREERYTRPHDQETVLLAGFDMLPKVRRVPLGAEQRVLVGEGVAVAGVDTVGIAVSTSVLVSDHTGRPVLVAVGYPPDTPDDEDAQGSAHEQRDGRRERGHGLSADHQGHNTRDDDQQDTQDYKSHGYLLSSCIEEQVDTYIPQKLPRML